MILCLPHHIGLESGRHERNWKAITKKGAHEMGDRDKIESVIGRSLVVKGDIQSSGTLRVDGAVEGTISARGTVIIANEGTVKADIKADHVVIGGTINGNVTAREKVEILNTGKLHGDVGTIAFGLVVREGAIFEGACKMKDAEGAKAASPKTPA
jgi:cytoskeletal protein CcmA (bactofilin family)